MVEPRNPWVTRWGRHDASWNVLELSEDDPDQDGEGGESDGSGLPGRWLVGQAVARWALTQPIAPSADIVAATFNLPLALAQEALGVLLQPSFGTLANAVQVWAGLQWHDCRDVTVGEAALAFHLSPAAIVEAVDRHYYMFLSGDRSAPAALVIEHEGE